MKYRLTISGVLEISDVDRVVLEALEGRRGEEDQKEVAFDEITTQAEDLTISVTPLNTKVNKGEVMKALKVFRDYTLATAIVMVLVVGGLYLLIAAKHQTFFNPFF